MNLARKTGYTNCKLFIASVGANDLLCCSCFDGGRCKCIVYSLVCS